MPGVPLKLAWSIEGSTKLCVPSASLSSKEPSTFPAFFNPAARLNRDVSVALARTTRPATFLDALAGVGARGVRVAREVPRTEVTLVEFNRTSLEIARRNVKANRVGGRCELVHEEANAYLHSRFGRLERFDAVDIDPFGTPAPYSQGAMSAAADGALVSVTATDTATLCGVYPSVALRRYGMRLVKTEYQHEAAVRGLLGFFARQGGLVDTGIRPVAAHTTLHYLRVYFRVLRGAVESDRCLKELGFVSACGSCHEVTVTREWGTSCVKCGARARCTGPLWTGSLTEPETVKGAEKECERAGWTEAAGALEALDGVDTFPPFSYSLEAITSREKVSSVKLRSVFEALSAMGRSAMRQPFGSGLKTNASYREVLSAVRES